MGRFERAWEYQSGDAQSRFAAKDGANPENFYVYAVCAPTRAEFLTGRYHFRTGVSGVSEETGRLNPDKTTLANLFKAAGTS